MAEKTSCGGENKRGKPCGAPPELVGPDGYCEAHRPGGSAEMRRRGQRGGYASTARGRSPGGLDPEELPPLDSHEAAQEWAEVVGRAVAEGRLGKSEGNTILRAVKEWGRADIDRRTAKALKAAEEARRNVTRFRPEYGPGRRAVPAEAEGADGDRN